MKLAIDECFNEVIDLFPSRKVVLLIILVIATTVFVYFTNKYVVMAYEAEMVDELLEAFAKAGVCGFLAMLTGFPVMFMVFLRD